MTDPHHDTRPDQDRHPYLVSILIAVIFAIAVAIPVGLALNKSLDASNTAKNAAIEARAASEANAVTIHNTCVASNKTKAEVIGLWEFLFTLNPDPDPVAQERIDQARAAVAKTYAQVICP